MRGCLQSPGAQPVNCSGGAGGVGDLKLPVSCPLAFPIGFRGWGQILRCLRCQAKGLDPNPVSLESQGKFSLGVVAMILNLIKCLLNLGALWFLPLAL